MLKALASLKVCTWLDFVDTAKSSLTATKNEVASIEVWVDTHAIQLAVWVPEKKMKVTLDNYQNEVPLSATNLGRCVTSYFYFSILLWPKL